MINILEIDILFGVDCWVGYDWHKAGLMETVERVKLM